MTLPTIYDSDRRPTTTDVQSLAEFLRHANSRDEKDLQSLLEGHPSLVGVLGYCQFISEHPLLKTDADNLVIANDARRRDRADLVAAKKSAIRTSYLSSHIIELKRANLEIAKKKEGFQLTDEANDAVNQLEQYRHWLTTVPQNRDLLRRIGWDIRQPTLTIVMGRDHEFIRNPGQLDEIKGHLLQRGIVLFTLDDVLRTADAQTRAVQIDNPITIWYPPKDIPRDARWRPSNPLWLSTIDPNGQSFVDRLAPAPSKHLRLGIVDSGIDLSSLDADSFSQANIDFAAFAIDGMQRVKTPLACEVDIHRHGTGVARQALATYPNIWLAIGSAIGMHGGTIVSVVRAIDWLLGKEEVAVINLSLALEDRRSPTSSIHVLNQVINACDRRGVWVVAAAGHGYGHNIRWPASHPEVISVGAVAQDGTIVSDFGYVNGKFKPEYLVDGCSIVGTSFAAPVVSAIVVWALEHGRDPHDVLSQCGTHRFYGKGNNAGSSVVVSLDAFHDYLWSQESRSSK